MDGFEKWLVEEFIACRKELKLYPDVGVVIGNYTESKMILGKYRLFKRGEKI